MSYLLIPRDPESEVAENNSISMLISVTHMTLGTGLTNSAALKTDNSIQNGDDYE